MVYTHFVDIDNCRWHMDSCCSFNLPGIDSLRLCETRLFVRHTTDYPYQNLWLELSYWGVDTAKNTDTIEIYLATNRGEWLGKKKNSLVEMPVLLQSKNLHNTTNKIEVKQLMRDTVLYGIYDVGLIVERNKKGK